MFLLLCLCSTCVKLRMCIIGSSPLSADRMFLFFSSFFVLMRVPRSVCPSVFAYVSLCVYRLFYA